MIMEALEKIADQLIALVRERELRRANFFREVVEPIHAVFNEFRRQHVTTFEEVREQLRRPDPSLDHALQIIDNKEAAERHLWLLFSKLESLATSSKAELKNHYDEYLRALGECLARTDGVPGDIIFYGGMKHEITRALNDIQRAYISNDDSAIINARSNGIRQVDSIVRRFHEYCAEVEVCYLRLRQYCLV